MMTNYSVLKRIWKVYEKIDSWVINIICFFFFSSNSSSRSWFRGFELRTKLDQALSFLFRYKNFLNLLAFNEAGNGNLCQHKMQFKVEQEIVS